MQQSAEPLLPLDLQDSIRNGKCVVFIGSGASVGCYDSWHMLVRTLCRQCQSNYAISDASSADELLDAAEDAKLTNNKEYHAHLCSHFGRNILINPLYDALLACNFKSYLTVNYDPVLAERYRLSRIQCNDEMQWYPYDLNPLLIENRTVYYLHGYIRQGATIVNDGDIVLSRSEFDRAYRPNHVLARFLIETFSRQDLCFVACRLQEPTFKYVMNVCKEEQRERRKILLARGGGPPKVPLRYIFLPDPSYGAEGVDEEQIQKDREEEELRLRSFDIQVRWYNDDHAILARTFSNLAGLPRPRLSGIGDGDNQYGI